MAAILYVDEDPQGLSSSIDDQWERDYTRRFNVVTDATTGPAYVRNNLTPPGGSGPIRIGQYYQLGSGEVDTGALVKNIRPSCTGKARANPATGAVIDGLSWVVEVECGPWNPADHTATGDPTAQPARASVRWVVREEVVTKDINGSPVLNTAGDPFDPPVVRERLGAVIAIKENVSARNLVTEAGYANQVNALAWLGFPPRTVKTLPTEFSDPLYSQQTGAAYFERTRQWEYNPDTWIKRVLNCGFKQIIASTSGGTTTYQKVTIDGDDGQPVTSPEPLDINGARIPPPFDLDSTADEATDTDIGPGDAGDAPPAAPGTPSPVVYLDFYIYGEMDFNGPFPYPSSILE